MGTFLHSRVEDHQGSTQGGSQALVYMTTFCIIGIGSFGCVLAGVFADRIGKIETIILCNMLSGICIWILPFLPHTLGLLPIILIAGLWGLSVNADSAQYSAMITETVPEDRVGTAVTLSIAIGFVITALAVYVVPTIVQGLGWEGAFPILGVGPLVGLGAISCLKCRRRLSARALRR